MTLMWHPCDVHTTAVPAMKTDLSVLPAIPTIVPAVMKVVPADLKATPTVSALIQVIWD